MKIRVRRLTSIIKTVAGIGCLLILAYAITRNALAYMYEGKPTDMVVIDCEPTFEYYTVTIRDSDGNEWVYYDDDAQPVGKQLGVVMDGNDIVDAR